MREQAPKTCAACGETFTHQGYGKHHDFCQITCRKAGRAACLFCGKDLQQPESGHRRDFCDPRCVQKYYRGGAPLDASYLEELNRSVCKCGCGRPITQPKNGSHRQFFDRTCSNRYYKTRKRNLSSLTEKWGGYAPETRKILRVIEEHHNLITAQQMARAIDREYIRRKDDSHQSTTYRCKTCGNEFKRRSSSRLSKDYCNRCLKGPRTVLAREEVDEIRHLAATQHLSCEELAEMYGKGKATIHHIINEYTWKPEHDPRRKESTP